MDKEVEVNENNIFSSENDVYKLLIQKASSANVGQYKAVAKNSLGSIQTTVCSLDVDTYPTIDAKFETTSSQLDSCEIIEEENKSIELNFEVNGKPEPQVEYFKDDVKFKPSEKRITLVKKDKIFKFSIPDLKASDAGVYKINCKNSCGEKFYLINLIIKSAPKFVKTFKNKIESLENNKLELIASIVPGVYPCPEFKWFRNEELIDEANLKNMVILRDTNTITLLVESLDLTFDSSKFKLVCRNELGACETETSVDVLAAPKFVLALNDSQPILNEPFEWNFEIDSNPEPKLKIIKNDKELGLKDKRVSLEKETETRSDRKVHKYKIKFNNIVADDLGLYKIDAVNKGGEASIKANLTVKGSPCFIRKPVDTSVVLNKPIKIECEISGIPNPDIIWLKNGEPLAENDRVKIENKLKTIYRLNIKTCIKEDAGTYTVKLSNDSGDAEASFNLSIQGNLCFYRIQFYVILKR